MRFIKTSFYSLIIVLMYMTMAFAAPVKVQEASVCSTNNTCAFSSNCTVGNTVVLCIGDTSANTPGVSSITNMNGFSGVGTMPLWLETYAAGNGTANNWCFIGLCQAAGTTLSWDSSTASQALMQEWSGVGTYAPDKIGLAAQASGGTLTPTITTVNANDIIVSDIYSPTSSITNPSSPWTSYTNQLTGSSTTPSNHGVFQNVSATGTYNPAYTITSNTHPSAGGVLGLAAVTSPINVVGGLGAGGGDVGTNTVIMNRPTIAGGILNNDLIVVSIFGYSGDGPGCIMSAPVTQPSGFANAFYDTIPASPPDGGPANTEHFYGSAKKSAGSEPSTYTFTFPQTGCTGNPEVEYSAEMVVVRGGDTTSPVDCVSANTFTFNVAPSVPGCTTTRNGDLLLFLPSNTNDGTVMTIPSNWGQLWNPTDLFPAGNGGANGSQAFASWKATAGATGTVSSTAGATIAGFAVQVAVRPPGGAPPAGAQFGMIIGTNG